MSKRSFTLLEMMVVLMLLSLVGTVVSVQAVKLIGSHRFEKEVGTLFTALQEAQILSVTHQTDLAVDIFLDKGQFYYQITTDEPFKETLLSQKRMHLASVQKVFIDKKKQKKIHFEMDSRGVFEPRGILTFESHDQMRYIDLQQGSLIRLLAFTPTPFRQNIPDEPRF